MGGDRTIRPISGNMASLEAAWCSTFRLGRGRYGPKQFLGRFEGVLQTDGYIAYAHVGGPGMVHVCCWAHPGRHFFDARKTESRRPGRHGHCAADG